MRTKTTNLDPASPTLKKMYLAFQAIEFAVWSGKDDGSLEGPDRIMATALIGHVWKQLEEASA